MSNRFHKIADKVEDLAEKQRRDMAEKKAKIKVTGRKVLGIKGNSKTKKHSPKSKVARGMQMLCAIIASVVALVVGILNIWPFNLFNRAGEDVSFGARLVIFLIIALPLYIIAALIAGPYIKKLEKKYGKQAW